MCTWVIMFLQPFIMFSLIFGCLNYEGRRNCGFTIPSLQRCCLEVNYCDGGSIVIAVLMMFLWVVYHALARIQRLFVSLLFIGMVLLKNWVGNTKVYQNLDEIWAVPAFSGSSSFSLSQAKLEFYIEGGGKYFAFDKRIGCYWIIDIVPSFMLAAWTERLRCKGCQRIFMHQSRFIYRLRIEFVIQYVRGEIKSGDRLPSVREMAVEMGVNPNTIQRTYSEIERDGIVETRRGQGTFVKNDPALIASLRTRIQTEVIETFVENMKEIGLSREEMLTAVQQFLKKQGDAE